MFSTKLIVWSAVVLSHVLDVVKVDGEDNSKHGSNCSSKNKTWYFKDAGERYCCPCSDCGSYGDFASENTVPECIEILYPRDPKRLCKVQDHLVSEKCVKEETFIGLSTAASSIVNTRTPSLNASSITNTTTFGLNDIVEPTTSIITNPQTDYLLVLFVSILVILCGLVACVCYGNRSAVKLLHKLVPNKKHKSDSIKDNSSDVSEVLDSQSDQEKGSIDENQNKKYASTLVLDIKDEEVAKISGSYDGQPAINEVKGGRLGGSPDQQHHSLPPTYSCEDPLHSNSPGTTSERRLNEAFPRSRPGPAGPSTDPAACSGSNSQPRSDFFHTASYRSSPFHAQSTFPGINNGAHHHPEQHNGFSSQFYPYPQHYQNPQFYQPYLGYQPHLPCASASMPPPSVLGNGTSNNVVLSNIKVVGNLTINHGIEATSRRPGSTSAALPPDAGAVDPPSKSPSFNLPSDSSQQKLRQSDEIGLRPVYPSRNDCKEALIRQGSTTLSSSDPNYAQHRSQRSAYSNQSLLRSNSHVRSRMPTEQDSLCDTNCHLSTNDSTQPKMLHVDVHSYSTKESQTSFSCKSVADENARFSSIARHSADDITSIAVQETSNLSLNDDISLLSTVIDQHDDCSSACLPS